jgi:hypothetical protein
MFFVGVASKELRVCVSGLESTLMGAHVSVDSKDSCGCFLRNVAFERVKDDGVNSP